MSYRHLFKILQWGLILFCLAFAIVGGVAPFASPCMPAPRSGR